MRLVVLLAILLAWAPPAQAGVEEVHYPAPFDGRPRRIWVRTPAVPADTANLLVAFDALDFLGEIPLPAMLDSLERAGRIPPTVAVLVDDSTGVARQQDLANRQAFADWLCDGVMPWIRAHYKVARDPHRAATCGTSAGGLAAAFIAFERPDVFGNAVSLSGAFWRNAEAKGSPPWEWLTGQVAASPGKDVRFVIDVGEKETTGVLGGTGPSILAANRRLRKALEAKGYDLVYVEAKGGTHSPGSWNVRLPPALVALNRRPPRSAAARP